ncbi:unnamed protein product [Protopolystoma xenopodis]|uniref:Uncharacterized protein n=1 Tax=Protopolystoma xenopodis TaxID=117903 RepID=A0A448WLC3_9PLAT|nr:unnamed protein product [Protopolystoma xenopodis]
MSAEIEAKTGQFWPGNAYQPLWAPQLGSIQAWPGSILSYVDRAGSQLTPGLGALGRVPAGPASFGNFYYPNYPGLGYAYPPGPQRL